MMWLTWRQHRAEALAAALLIAGLGAVLLIFGLPMHAGFVHTGAAGCLAQPPAADATAYRNTCASAIEHFRNDFGYTKSLFPWLNLVPLAIGAFIGAPLLAREAESGTWQLAWTQGVARRRWLTVKLATLAALAVVLDGAFAALVTWYRKPWDALNGRFGDGFDVEGLALPVYALFAFAVGAAAGAFIRRSVPALAVAAATFGAVRVPIEAWLRPHFQTPVTLVYDPMTQSGAIGRDAWAIAQGIVDAGGHALSSAQYWDVYKAALIARTDPPTYIHDQGMHVWTTFQPADRFWTFQFIEASIYVGIATILLILVFRQVRHRAL